MYSTCSVRSEGWVGMNTGRRGGTCQTWLTLTAAVAVAGAGATTRTRGWDGSGRARGGGESQAGRVARHSINGLILGQMLQLAIPISILLYAIPQSSIPAFSSSPISNVCHHIATLPNSANHDSRTLPSSPANALARNGSPPVVSSSLRRLSIHSRPFNTMQCESTCSIVTRFSTSNCIIPRIT